LRDVQNEPDYRNIPLDKVGVEGLLYPINVMHREEGLMSTVATVSLTVDLPHNFRGTHMSRFVEVLKRFHGLISLHTLEEILDATKEALDAETAHIELDFPYFIKKKAPVSGVESYMNYGCKFMASKRDRFDFVLEVRTPVHLLCPCSKEISKYSAHNQRGEVLIQVRMKGLVWIEDLVEISESSASAPLYSILKREDEKFITERAYENPKFVEDVARDVALRLDDNPKVTWYYVRVTSFESIHNHNAYACLRREKVAGRQSS